MPRDDDQKKPKPVWDKPRPKGLGESKPLSPGKLKKARAYAAAGGRDRPALVDNLRAARGSGRGR